MATRRMTIKAIVAKYGPSPAPKPWAFEIGDKVRHVSGETGTVIGRTGEFYSLDRSDFYRVITSRGINELYPESTIARVAS